MLKFIQIQVETWYLEFKMKNKIIIFDDKKIRRIWYNEDWYISIIDVVEVLTESNNPRRYWSDLKSKLVSEGSEVYEKIVQLKLESQDGKLRETDCSNKEGVFRIIQSIPSKRAEPFKIWLAKIGGERIDEIENPELSIDRAMKTYLEKGYSEKWINQRIKTIEVRKDLTDEWNRVGVESSEDYAILTNDMTKAWSGLSVKDYKDFKNLKKENLRDNMTNLELVLNMLAEATTTEFSRKENPNSFEESRNVAVKGGNVSGNTRKEIEEKLGKKIVSSKNSREIIDLDKEKEVLKYEK